MKTVRDDWTEEETEDFSQVMKEEHRTEELGEDKWALKGLAGQDLTGISTEWKHLPITIVLFTTLTSSDVILHNTPMETVNQQQFSAPALTSNKVQQVCH